MSTRKKDQHAHSPVTHEDLRAAVFEGATECREQLPLIEKCRRTEVDQFDIKLLVDDDVLVLDVTVDDIQSMEVRYRGYHLLHSNYAC